MQESHKIHVLDLAFLGKELAIFSFLIETDTGPILVETGPHSSHESLVHNINKCGYAKEEIKHVFLTHIHLDHAGGAWCFAEHGAKIYLHPFGFRHMHDPSKLLASAKMIYKEKMDMLWGTLKPIPEELLIQVGDMEEITIGKTVIRSIHSPGHAKHHIAWQIGKNLFTGDVAGVRINKGAIVPPCPPPDINIEDWENSIEKILAIPEIESYFLTHGAEITDCADHMNRLRDILHMYADFIKPYYDNKTDPKEILKPFQAFVKQNLLDQGMSAEHADAYEAANPPYMSVAGLLRYFKKREERNA